jgi:hypothetical protein
MKRLLETLLFAFAGWAACGATMGIGLSLVPLDNLLILHAVAAPIYFGVLSLIYFRRWRHAGPLTTALIFVGFVFLLDFFVVALIILPQPGHVQRPAWYMGSFPFDLWDDLGNR